MTNIFFLLLFLGLSTFNIISAPYSYAGLFRVESETYSSARMSDEHQFELPFSENMSTSYISNKKDFEFNSNFSLLADPTGNLPNIANLYLLDLKFQAIPDFLEIKIGRSLQSSLASGSLDMIATNFFWINKQIQFGPFIGIEKQLEIPTTDIMGLHLDFYSNETLPYFISTRLIERRYRSENNNISNSSFPKETHARLLQISGKKSFSGNWSPEILIDTQTNITRKNLERFEAGLDLYPSILTYTTLRILSFDILPDSGTEQPIYSIFSLGRLYETRMQYQYKIHSNLISGITFFTDNYQLQETKRTTGYGSEWQLKWLQDAGFIDNNIYAFASYGGKVIGNRILVQSNLKNEAYAIFDIAYYEKITSSKRNVINTEIGCSKYFGKQYKLTFGGELNSNNILLYDLRAFAKLTFLLWNDS